jgi:pimeloyl-ACP methyl ester carboxylesterase
MATSLPLILLSGMGADERLFVAQKAVLPQLTVPAWLPPEPDDTLASYGQRMAAAVDPGVPCLIGGVSLGGMVAVEMARHLDAKACLLIASVRAPRELPRRVRVLKPLVWLIPTPLASLPPLVSRLVLAVAGRFLSSSRRSLLEQLAATDGRFLKWASLAILRWRSVAGPTVPIVQIHGDRDRILPHALTHPDVLVAGAGHVLPVTHPIAVNQFLRDQLDRFAG